MDENTKAIVEAINNDRVEISDVLTKVLVKLDLCNNKLTEIERNQNDIERALKEIKR